MSTLSGYRALVTGASSGLGAALARELAGRGADLIITARRRERLEALADELRGAHDVAVEVVACDLSEPAAAARLADAAGDRVDILINNAGFGHYRPFGDAAWERHADLLAVNVAAPVELTHRLLPRLRAAGRRTYVLNVSSIGAYLPIPYFATYVASKHYLLGWSESLGAELSGTNVSVTCVCPGGIRTEFVETADQRLAGAALRFFMTPERVARIAVRAMLRRRRTVIPGLTYKLMRVMLAITPRRIAAASSQLVLRRPGGRADAPDTTTTAAADRGDEPRETDAAS